MGPNADIVSLDPKHRSEDVVDYHFGDLAPEARAEFEQHLETCLGCQQAVKTAGILFPAVSQVLAVPKRRKTTDELVSMMMAETKRLEAEDRKGVRASWRRARHWALPLAVAAAAAAAAPPAVEVVERIVAKVTHHDTRMAAPRRPTPDKR